MNNITTNPVKNYLENNEVKDRIKEILQDKSQQFVISLLSLVNSNSGLEQCKPSSIVNAALTAASLNLPINQNLGFAYIIAYNQKQKDGSYEKVAQFQAGYKAFIQLAQRSGQFKTINVSDVRQGEIERIDRLTGEIDFTWNNDRDKLPVIGYVGYMELKNGFKKSLYLTIEQLKKHGLKFSKTAKQGYGLWVDEFDAMASKTVIKLLLSKYAPLTVDMQKATLADQSVIEGEDQYSYVDNQPILPQEVAQDKENNKVLKHIAESKTLDDLEVCREYVNESTQGEFDKKLNELEK